MEGKDLKEANELIWQQSLERGFRAAGRTMADAQKDRKSAEWKIWIAAQLKRNTSAPSTWIAQRLNMGAPQLVGVYVNQLLREIEQASNSDYEKFISRYTE
jgi:hypothetical protein